MVTSLQPDSALLGLMVLLIVSNEALVFSSMVGVSYPLP